MLEKTLNRIMAGARTPEGKIIAILLTLSLALMTWNATSIKAAFAYGENDTVLDVTNDKGVEGGQATEPEADGGQATEPEADADADQATGVDGDQATEPEADGDQATEPEADGDQATEPEADGDQATEPEADADQATEPEADADQATEPEAKRGETKAGEDAEVWTVKFYNRDAHVIETREIAKSEAGTAIGTLPKTIDREGYNSFWAVGTIDDHGTTTIEQRIDENYLVTKDLSIVPDFDKITYTVTFYKDAEKTETVATETTDIDSNYCVNNIPAVPTKSGYSGKWVYSGGDFDNTVVINGATDVWPEYDQNVFDVTFVVNDEVYETDTYYSGDALEIPAEPVIEGKQFTGWFIGETQYVGGEKVNSDLTLTAAFKDMYAVSFVVNNGETEEVLHQYFRTTGDPIGTMPEDPFVAGKAFEKWVNKDTGEEVTAETIVNGPITAEAQFRDLSVYNITVDYYYLNDSGNKVSFNTDLISVESSDLPYTITAPASTQTDPNEVSGGPVYYPTTPTVKVEESAFDDQGKATVRIQYVKYTAVYDVVHKLKDLEGDGYSEIARDEDVQGVLNSFVTPTPKEFDYAVLEMAEGKEITQEEGQELEVKYTRKNFQLSFETNGGSYVAGGTYLYGTNVNLASAAPTKSGYVFDGWCTDEGLTEPAGTSVEIQKDTTLYAKWKGAEVNYTVVYMFEKYNDSGTASSYVYDNSETLRAVTDSTVKATDSSIPDKTRTGWEKDAAKNAESSVVVAADGSSVLFVYYKLREYTLTFDLNHYSGNTYMTIGGTTYYGNSSTRYSIKVKLGQNIASLWPTLDNATIHRNNSNFTGWDNFATKQLIMNTGILPTSGTTRTFDAQWGGSTKFTINYYLENADDDGYTLSTEYSQTLYNSSNAYFTAKTITGYTYDHGNSGARNTTTYNFYYNRDTYKIDYYYGSTKLNTINDVKFEATISGSTYNWTPTAAQCGVDSDYTFEGWYSDSGLTTKYEFSTMPASNLVLYAKWTAPKYTVTFVDEDGTTELADAQTVEKYEKVTRPSDPTKTGYTFEGWYTEAGGDTLFDWNTQITTNTKVYAKWSEKVPSYVVKYIDEKGVDVAPSKNVTNPNFKIGQEVTEQAIAIAGYRPNDNSKKLTLSGDEEHDVITFVYKEKSEFTKYTVNYVIAEGEEGAGAAVATTKTAENVPGNTTVVTELAAAVDYEALYAAHPELEGIEFYPILDSQELILAADEAQNVLTFYYSSFKHTTVKVNYVDVNGDPITGVHSETLKVGNTFTLARTPIDGWELNKAVVGSGTTGEAAGTDYKITEEVASGEGLEFTLVYQKKVTITANSLSKAYDGTELVLPDSLEGKVTVEGLLEGDSLSAVDFTYANTDNTAGNGRINAGIATVTPKDAVIVGTHTAGNYYKVRYISGTLEVTKLNVTVRIEPDRWSNAVYDGTEKPTGFTNTAKKTIDQYILISNDSYKNSYLDTIWNKVISLGNVKQGGPGLGYYVIAEKDAGTYTYSLDFTLADLPKDDNYSVNLYVRGGLLEILPVNATVTTGSDSKAYDGTALTKDEASIEGLVEADMNIVTVTATGSQTEVGWTDNTYRIDWGTTNKDNYNLTENLGTLTVTENSKEVTLTAASANKTYDGTALTDATVTATGLPEGFTVEATASGSQTNAGEAANVVNDGYVIKNAEGVDKTANFTNVTKVNGKLTVNPAAVTITAKSEAFAYDGNAHTNAGYDVTGLVGDDAITAVVEGTITFVSESPVANKVKSYEFTKGTASNYTVTTVDGQLTMTAAEAAITITAASGEKTYDGTALTNSEVTLTSGTLLAGDQLVAEANGSATNVADTTEGNNPVKADYKVMHGTEDVTANYAITTVPGTLTIKPAAVTVTAKSEEFTYDGNAHTNAGYDVTGLVGNDAIKAVVTGSITFPSESPVVNKLESYEFTTGTAGNYTVTTVDGQLTMTAASQAITITAASGEKTYDGTALTNSEVTLTSGKLLAGDELVAEANGSATNVADTTEGNNPVKADYKVMHGTEDVTANYAITTVPGTLTIKPAAVTVTAKSEEFTYDGNAHTNAGYDVTGLVGDDAITAVVEGTITFVSESPVANVVKSHEFTKGTAGNYTVTYKNGELTMTAASQAITITAASGEKTYDGTALTNSEVTLTSGTLLAGDQLVAEANGSATNVADTAQGNNSVAEGYKVMHGTEDVTANYTITTVAGTLTIKPATLTIVTPSATKVYDGTPLTADGTIAGFVNNETATFKTTGSQTEVGGTAGNNTYSLTWDGTAKEGNYTISETLGTLTVTEFADQIVVTTTGGEFTYDGKAHGATVEVSTLPTGYTLETATSNATATDVTAEAIPATCDTLVIKNAAGEDVTSKLNIKKVDGTIKINPATLTVTTPTAEKPYDGDPLTAAGTITGFVNNETATFATTGTQTYVGESDNTYSLTWDGTAEQSNYTVTEQIGKLKVTEPSDPGEIGTKSHEGEDYKLGETITWTISVTNVYDEAKDITLVEKEGFTLGQSTFNNVAAGATVTTTATHVVTEKDILAGEVNNSVEVRFGDIDVIIPDPVPTDVDDLDTTLTVNKKITNTPEGGAFKLGDTIEYSITVTNDGNATYKNVKVTDEVTGDSWTIEELAVGDTKTFTTSYKVVEADILAGEVANTAVAKGDPIDDPKDPDNPKTPEGEDTVTTGDEDDPDGPTPPIEDPNSHMTVTKETTSTPASEKGYALGEEITYKITVTNDGNLTIKDITVTDELTDDVWTVASLAPGNSEEFTASYTVTEADILKGSVLNEAVAEGSGPEGHDPDPAPGTKEEPTDDLDTTLTVNKKITNTPEGGAFKLGDTIEYSITVTNDGNVTYSGVVADDDLTGQTWTIDSLKPGDERTFTATHTVTEADILEGSVTNTATAEGQPIPDPKDPENPKTPEGEDTTTTGDADDPDGPTPPIDKPNPSLNVVKTVTSTPSNNATYGVGETITYDITVTNDGNLTLSNISVSDAMSNITGVQPTLPPESISLAPGEGQTYTVSYTVLVTDAGNTVANSATATAPNPVPGGGPVTGTDTTPGEPTTPPTPPIPPTPTPTPTPTPVPFVPAADTPAVPATPAVTPIADNPTPQAQTIEDDGNALGDGGAWSLFDLICTIVATILAVIMLIFALGRNRKEGDDEETAAAKTANGEEVEEDEVYKRKRIGRILSIIPAVGAIVLFILTQDLTQPMTFFDNWSLVFGIIGIVNIVLAIVTRKKTKDGDDEQQQTPQTGYVPAGPASL